MCGISGKAYFDKKEVSLQNLRLMTSKLAHRGPDDTGYYISEDRQLGFGHNRLSIIDLSKKGHQPMIYNNRYVITFNGEIYNFLEQKEKLLKEGYVFKSNSDTEVILALYSKYGKACLNYLRGMFAFAIYDTKEKTLFLARDRIGKKPLKYFLTDNVLIFASELKAILTQPEVKKLIDYKAVELYLSYGYVPAPFTGFVGRATTARSTTSGRLLISGKHCISFIACALGFTG
jgi:asparagine synthase (glutamine-hydrolysing)